MKAKIITLIFLCSTLFYTAAAYSCTTFCIHTSDELVFGRNYDWSIGDGIVFVNKKDVVKTAFTKKGNPASWVSKYGSITFNQYGREFPTGGMNEAGLVVELMWLEETKYPTQDERSTVGGILQWIQYQLDNCETIQEVIDTDKFLRIPEGAVPVHYLITDRYGNSASIEFLNGKLVQHSGETMKFRTLANDTYEKSVQYLKTLKEFGGTEEFSNDNGSLDRFARACSMVNQYSKAENGNAVDYGFEILDKVSQGESTKWSIVYDIKNMKVYFKTYDNSKLKSIYVPLLDFNCSSPAVMIDIDSDLEGNINSSFIKYTREANRKLIEDAYYGVDFLKSVPASYRDEASLYPEKLTCRSKSEIELNSFEKINETKTIYFTIMSGIILTAIILLVYVKKQKVVKDLS